MAIELCSEGSGHSPRISFSHDFCHSDVLPIAQRPFRSKSSGLNGSIDFDFCVRKSFDQESFSSADELFSNGKMLPSEVKQKNIPVKQTDLSTPSQPSVPEETSQNDSNLDKKKKKKESPKDKRIARDETGEDEVEEKQSSKSFWRFKRSSSLNCGSGYGGSFCPLPLLSRSNSTGSTPNVKQSSLSKDSYGHKQGSQRHSSSYKSSAHSTNYQKPPLKKGAYGSFGNGVQVNPVLNVSSGNLFGLGSIFFNGKDRSRKR